MSDLDFSKPAQPAPAPPPPPVYNAAMALEFFKSAGKPEGFAPGQKIFAEDEKAGLFSRPRMYVLVLGEIEMQVQGKAIGSVNAGEVFGEMGVIAGAARTATAVAKGQVTVIGLDDKQFLAGLQLKPEFALMLMSIMNNRLRSTITRLRASGSLQHGTASEAPTFDKKLLQGLVRPMQGQDPARYDAGKVIMQEGQAGALMYIVLEGRVAITIKGALVSKASQGGIFGEMALVDQAPRAATAVAETDFSLLAINRPTFLNLIKSSPAFGGALLAGLAGRAKEMADRSK
jgi:CRP-like cAMP-binding protein